MSRNEIAAALAAPTAKGGTDGFTPKIKTCPKCGARGAAFVCSEVGCPVNGGAAYPWTASPPPPAGSAGGEGYLSLTYDALSRLIAEAEKQPCGGGSAIVARIIAEAREMGPMRSAGAAGGGSGDLGALSAEAVAAAYYNCMIGNPKEFWPHHDGWAGKSETFKAKVRDRMAKALKIAALSAPTPDRAVQGEPVASAVKVEAAAKRLYDKHTDDAGIHSNRFPSWRELSEEGRAEWRAKVPAPTPDLGALNTVVGIEGLCIRNPAPNAAAPSVPSPYRVMKASEITGVPRVPTPDLGAQGEPVATASDLAVQGRARLEWVLSQLADRNDEERYVLVSVDDDDECDVTLGQLRAQFDPVFNYGKVFPAPDLGAQGEPVAITPTPDQVAHVRDLQASLQSAAQIDNQTLIGPAGPAAGFDGYGSQARPLHEAPAAPRTGSGVSVEEIEKLCDRLDHLNPISQPSECDDAMDEARLMIIALFAKAPRDGGAGQ